MDMQDRKTIFFVVIITILTALAAALLYSLDMLPQFQAMIPPTIISSLAALWCPLWGIRACSQPKSVVACAKALVSSSLILLMISLTLLALDPIPGELWSVFWVFLFFSSLLLTLTFTVVFLFELWDAAEHA